MPETQPVLKEATGISGIQEQITLLNETFLLTLTSYFWQEGLFNIATSSDITRNSLEKNDVFSKCVVSLLYMKISNHLKEINTPFAPRLQTKQCDNI